MYNVQDNIHYTVYYTLLYYFSLTLFSCPVFLLTAALNDDFDCIEHTL